MNREILHVVTHKERLDAPVRGLIVEAHPDDAAMLEGVDVVLAKSGVGLTVVTFTDGAARKLAAYTPDELRMQRREESPNSVTVMGGAQVYNADLPDGSLSYYEDDAKAFLDTIIGETNPHFLLAPNPRDSHLDHAVAGEITRLVGGGEIPLYFMDTIDGKAISPTHYISLSRRVVRQRKKAFSAHTSQVTDLPLDEQLDIQSVLQMPHRRGYEVGQARAAVLTQHTGELGDPIAEILGEKIIYRR